MKLRLNHLAAALALAGLSVPRPMRPRTVVVAVYSSFTTTGPV
jgi:hypothetical protein